MMYNLIRNLTYLLKKRVQGKVFVFPSSTKEEMCIRIEHTNIFYGERIILKNYETEVGYDERKMCEHILFDYQNFILANYFKFEKIF